MLIQVEKLRAICDPYEEVIWQHPVSLSLVKHCVDNNYVLNEPVQGLRSQRFDLDGLVITADLARIAFFVKNGWKDPISIDVGVPSLGCYVEWPIIDGNHRFSAAIYRGDTHIEAEVSGQVDFAEELFGNSLG